MFRKVKKLHFVGIGGIGMSGIAELLLNLDFEISGSDILESEIVQKLKSKGASIHIGHDAKNLGDAEVLVYSSAVKENNPEIQIAKQRNIPIIRRAEMLGELIDVKETSIAVGGTHGKTSTSSMLGAILAKARLDPTLVVGGLVQSIGTNSMLGSGDIIVVEADEYDRSFLALNPTLSLVTNIELEHTDIYSDLDDMKQAFVQFCNSVPFYGAVALCIDSHHVNNILPEIRRPILTYGLHSNADVRAENISYNKTQATFTLIHKGAELGTILLQVPGEHNILNSLGAACIGIELGLVSHDIIQGLNKYNGVRRRFEIKGTINDILVVDDYAHHPTEVKATLKAANDGWDRRIISIFQPHLFTRTRDFFMEFANAFLNSDVLIITEIYPAREEPIKGITGELVAKAAENAGHKNVLFIPDLEDLSKQLDLIAQPGDMVLTMGAGTIWRYSDKYFSHLKNVEAAA
mgnify:CR=1 FL=1